MDIRLFNRARPRKACPKSVDKSRTEPIDDFGILDPGFEDIGGGADVRIGPDVMAHTGLLGAPPPGVYPGRGYDYFSPPVFERL